MFSYKECQEYIKDQIPFVIVDYYHSIYKYDSQSVLIYNSIDDYFTFIESRNSDISLPLSAGYHRVDGPAYVSIKHILFYFNNKELEFEQWLKLAHISDQEKVKLKLKYST